MRRVRDSNPRYPFGYTHFPGVLLQPLGQLSIFYNHKKRAQIYKLKMNLTFDQLIKFCIQKIKILRLPFNAKN